MSWQNTKLISTTSKNVINSHITDETNHAVGPTILFVCQIVESQNNLFMVNLSMDKGQKVAIREII
jgi:hypothetical protein